MIFLKEIYIQVLYHCIHRARKKMSKALKSKKRSADKNGSILFHYPSHFCTEKIFYTKYVLRFLSLKKRLLNVFIQKVYNPHLIMKL